MRLTLQICNLLLRKCLKQVAIVLGLLFQLYMTKEKTTDRFQALLEQVFNKNRGQNALFLMTNVTNITNLHCIPQEILETGCY